MIVRTAADIGGLIRTRRRALGLDQRELAARVGVSRLWVIEIERGKPRAELGLVLRTLAALGIHLDAATEREASGAEARSVAGAPDLDAIVRAARTRR